jgi:hypothetical protein
MCMVYNYDEPSGEPRQKDPDLAHRAAVKMSALIKSELGIDIAPINVRILVKVHFDQLAKYAHIIHEGGF